MKTFLSHYPETAGGIVFSENMIGEEKFMGKTIRFETLSAAPEAVGAILA